MEDASWCARCCDRCGVNAGSVCVVGAMARGGGREVPLWGDTAGAAVQVNAPPGAVGGKGETGSAPVMSDWCRCMCGDGRWEVADDEGGLKFSYNESSINKDA
jgi:hypothetical protein